MKFVHYYQSIKKEKIFSVPYETFTKEEALVLMSFSLDKLDLPVTNGEIVLTWGEKNVILSPSEKKIEFQFLFEALTELLHFESLYITKEFKKAYQNIYPETFLKKFTFIKNFKNKQCLENLKKFDSNFNKETQNILCDIFKDHQNKGFCINFESPKVKISLKKDVYIVKDLNHLLQVCEHIKTWENKFEKMGVDFGSDNLTNLSEICFTVKIEDINIIDFDPLADPLAESD